MTIATNEIARENGLSLNIVTTYYNDTSNFFSQETSIEKALRLSNVIINAWRLSLPYSSLLFLEIEPNEWKENFLSLGLQ